MRLPSRLPGPLGLLWLGLLGLSLPSLASAGPFILETVDEEGDVGRQTSLAIDSQGEPHISYYDLTNRSLKYAEKIGGTWKIETVDEANPIGAFTSLALDAGGNPHISYYGGELLAGDLKYATRSGGVWSIELADGEGDAGGDTSIDLDSQGHPHISYFRISDAGGLKYASRSPSGWNIELVDTENYAGSFSSLELDAAGNPHISYVGERFLKYAAKSGGQWMIETVDPTEAAGWTSIELDAQGRPHISYLAAGTTMDLRYAVKTSGTWAIETVDSPGQAGWYNSLVLDAQEVPHISYHIREPSFDLRYAVRSGGTWFIQTVDSEVFGGQSTSLQIDGLGDAHISYYDNGNENLKYARSFRATPVELASFDVTSEDGAVWIRWQTTLEDQTAGFNVLRANSGDDLFLRINRPAIPSSGGGARYEFVDRGVVPGRAYWYRLEAVGLVADDRQLFPPHEVTVSRSLPQALVLETSRPNPFNPSTIITFALPAAGPVTLRIFDVQGRQVRTLVERTLARDRHSFAWDGRDDRGKELASGVYTYRLEFGAQALTRKLILAR